jgi:CBS domain-containing protein
MKASDVMTRDVVAIGPDMPAQDIAKLLLAHGISAVPVVDREGIPIGMVSEGDLLPRDERERIARRDWWLALLAEGEILSRDFLASLQSPGRRARDMMTAPVITVEEDTGIEDIATLLAAYQIKRVPVVRDDRIVGIVSRADLIRALTSEQPQPVATAPASPTHDLFAWVDRHFGRGEEAGEPASSPPVMPPGESWGADDFRGLVADFAHKEAEHKDEVRRAVAHRRREQIRQLIDHHISDRDWRALLHQARQAAENGQTEFLLLRFPSQLCGDGGRAINAPLAQWPATLRGEAAEMYLRWERDLKPRGFGLAARVLDYPGGMPGDIGLFLVWKR